MFFLKSYHASSKSLEVTVVIMQLKVLPSILKKEEKPSNSQNIKGFIKPSKGNKESIAPILTNLEEKFKINSGPKKKIMNFTH